MDKPTTNHRKIQSFVLRQGRFTKGQQKALDCYFDDYVIPYAIDKKINLESVFSLSQETILEIGFGMGNSLAKMAKENPKLNYLGIEVHLPGVGALLNQIAENKIENLKISHHDAVEVLENQIDNGALSGIQIFFPDPWHKKRHHKRRLIQKEFCDLLAKKLKTGGFLHIATDWQDYALWCHDILSVHAGFTNTSSTGDYIPRPEHRPLTKFESRGQRLGHGVWDLMYQKC